MTFLIYTLIAFFSLGAVATVGQIGRLREPISPAVATVTVVINVSLIIALIVLGL